MVRTIARACAVFALVFGCSANAITITLINSTPRHIVALRPGNKAFVSTGDQYFTFLSDLAYTYTCVDFNPGYGTATNGWFGIPYYNPTPGAPAGEVNPSYRDLVSSVQLAQSLGKPINIYVNGCLDVGVPRVVGIVVGL